MVWFALAIPAGPSPDLSRWFYAHERVAPGVIGTAAKASLPLPLFLELGGVTASRAPSRGDGFTTWLHVPGPRARHRAAVASSGAGDLRRSPALAIVWPSLGRGPQQSLLDARGRIDRDRRLLGERSSAATSGIDSGLVKAGPASRSRLAAGSGDQRERVVGVTSR